MFEIKKIWLLLGLLGQAVLLPAQNWLSAHKQACGVPEVAAVWLDHDSSLVTWTDSAQNTNVNDHSIFQAGSLGKIVIAMGIFRLMEEEKLTLEEKVERLIPDLLDNPWQALHPVTVHHLLEHTSGLDDLHFNEYFTKEKRPLKTALTHNPNSKKIRFRPGSRPAYSNIGYAILARIIEVKTGESWSHWLSRELLNPLGMIRSGFGPIDSLLNRVPAARLYKQGGQTPRYLYQPSLSFYTCSADLGRLLRCLAQRGSPVLSPTSITRMESLCTSQGAKGGIQIGYGAGLQMDYWEGTRTASHTGIVDGYAAILEYCPEEGTGFAALFNGSPKGGTKNTPLTKALRAIALTKRKNATQTPKDKETKPLQHPASWLGTYHLANPRNALLGRFEAWMESIKVQQVSPYALSVGGAHFYQLEDGKLIRSGESHIAGLLWEEGGHKMVQVGKRVYQKHNWLRSWAFLCYQGLLGVGILYFLLEINLFTSGKGTPSLALLALPTFELWGLYQILTGIPPWTLGSFGPWPIAVFVLSLGIGWGWLPGWTLLRSWKSLKGLQKLGATILAFGNGALAIWLFDAGWIALMTWRH